MIGWIGNIEDATVQNTTFRTTLFTGELAQLTVMRLGSGEEIGLEMHDGTDQFIRIEEGRARVEMGPAKDALTQSQEIEDDWAVVIPSGTWHNVVNIGEGDLKLYSLYAPPEHPRGTVHDTKADADAAEAAHPH